MANIIVEPKVLSASSLPSTLAAFAPFALLGLASMPSILSGNSGIDLSVAPLMGVAKRTPEQPGDHHGVDEPHERGHRQIDPAVSAQNRRHARQSEQGERGECCESRRQAAGAED
ncbi:hypothetical protein, partial [Pseudolysinimonas sp.]|uniref:hypothetical protein n=1 Tax=Pseudolysinimonas sp. TaxID=2680009 RepID=UPI00286D20B9